MNPGDALDRVRPPGWGGEVAGVLHDGVAGRSYLVMEGEARFVLRVDGPLARVLGLDRAREHAVLAAAAAAGLARAPLGWWPGPPAVLLRPWVPGAAWSVRDFRAPARWPALAALLGRVHAIPAPHVAPLDAAAAAARYARQAGAAGRALARRVAARTAELPAGLATTLCHGDPVAGNVVGDPDMSLIDWEYAAPGDPLFDAAAVAAHHAFDDAQAQAWLSCLVGAERAREPHTTRRYACWREIYVALAVLWLGVVARERGLGDAAADLYRDLQSALDRAR